MDTANTLARLQLGVAREISTLVKASAACASMHQPDFTPSPSELDVPPRVLAVREQLTHRLAAAESVAAVDVVHRAETGAQTEAAPAAPGGDTAAWDAERAALLADNKKMKREHREQLLQLQKDIVRARQAKNAGTAAAAATTASAVSS
jgi:hypothetical protein